SRRAVVGSLARAPVVASARSPAAAVAGAASASPLAVRRNRSAIQSGRARRAQWQEWYSFDRSSGNPQPPQRALEILGDLLEWQRQGGAPSDQHIIMAA